ncbi:MAG: hypothetical protein HYZ81_22960 [Nitrospinae bacterium]|nr:hypothetical protein [Nitrospinota bacterium]
MRFVLLVGMLVTVVLATHPLWAYEVVPVADGGVLAGKIVFRGTPPEPKKVLISKDIEVCGAGHRERRDVEVAADGGLTQVVVSIEGVSRGKAWPTESFILDQRGCAFRPYLQVVRNGAELVILNSDPMLHNIHTYELIGGAKRTLFNVAQPKFKPKVVQTIKVSRGKAIRVECDAHDFMLGWIAVSDHPYVSLVGENGAFEIADVPPGTYKVRAWHPFLGEQVQEVTIPAQGRASVTLEFK